MSDSLRTSHDILAERLLCDEHILSKLQAHAARLQAARQSAAVTLVAAQAHLETLDAEIASVNARLEPLRSSVQEMRVHLRPCMTARLPNELLRAIFLQLTPVDWSGRDEFQSTPPEYERSRALWPFTLSAVCKGWRELALHTPSLWSLVTTPNLTNANAAQLLSLVKTLCQRSRPSPIDILLPWSSTLWDERHAAPMLDTLATESIRWRGFSLQYSSKSLPASVYRLLRCPMPLLEYFSITFLTAYQFFWPSSHPPALTFCPNLRFLHWTNTMVLPGSSVGALTHLAILKVTLHMPCASVWNFVSSCPGLECISLHFLTVPSDDTAVYDQALSLPRLRVLQVDIHAAKMLSSNSPNVSFPSLERIETQSANLVHLRPLFDVVQSSVKTLNITLLHDHTAQHVDCLRALGNLNQVWIRFHNSADWASSQTPLLCALATKEPSPGGWILPNLEIISVYGDMTDDAGDALVTLLSARGAERGIKQVFFGRHGACSAPEWVKAQIEVRLGRSL